MMTEAQIKYMVDRFLGWRLPENFNPDGDVSFKRLENRHHHPEASPFYPMPGGTNYWDDPSQRAEGPEECADADISYWGED